jgi:hypothetical protein
MPTPMMLGKKRGIVQDPRTFKLADLLTGDAPKPPAAAGTGSPVASWPLFRNDQIGDCGLASQGHRIIAQERSARQREIQVSDKDVVEAYSAVSGYDPATGANDNGVYLLDVCNYMRKVGMGREKDGSRHTIAAFAKVDVRNHDHVRLASWMFGGLYYGAGLPISAQGQIHAGQPWTVVSGDSGKPYSWGGHAMYSTGYDKDYVGLVTWGRRQKATWEWWDTYVDEAYVHVTEDYMSATGKTPRGFDSAKLQEFLNQLG